MSKGKKRPQQEGAPPPKKARGEHRAPLPAWVRLTGALFLPGECEHGFAAEGRAGPDALCRGCSHAAAAHQAAVAGGDGEEGAGPVRRFLVALRNARLGVVHRFKQRGALLRLPPCSDEVAARNLAAANAALVGVRVDDPATAVEALIALDDLYYRVFYASGTGALRGAVAGAVPAPAAWFGVWVWDPRVACPCVAESEHAAYLVKNLWRANDLLRLWRCKMYESRWLLGPHGRGECSESALDRSGVMCTSPRGCAPGGMGGGETTMKGPNPLCLPLHARWRDACRDFACHVYAYAVPTETALRCLERHAPLVELGAGTGYWSAVLRARQVDIVALDKDPLSVQPPTRGGGGGGGGGGRGGGGRGGGAFNEYHGRSLAFTAVRQGTAASLGEYAGRTLFLCYPPPGSDACGTDALRQFQGEKVVYVGEWDGDTANRRFQQELVRDFNLVRRIGCEAMANWPGTCYTLTVWRRKKGGRGEGGGEGGEAEGGAMDTILSCFSEGCGQRARVRCRFSWDVSFCGPRCAEAAWPRHQELLRARHLWFDKPLSYHNKDHFRAIKT